jgi:hypothetical protein
VNEKIEAPGTYLQERIAQKTREAAARHNDAGLISMWPEAAKEVMAKFPKLTAEQRAALRGNVESQIHTLCVRTKKSPHEFTMALQAVARILSS